MLKCIAIDMDGTLLNPQQEISAENARAIKLAQEQGVLVVIATGRMYDEAVEPLEAAGIACPIICMNGAEVYVDGSLIATAPIKQDQFYLVDDTLKAHDIYYEVYTNRGIFSDHRPKAEAIFAGFLKDTIHDEETLRTMITSRFETGKMTVVGDYESLAKQSGLTIYKLLAFSSDIQILALAKEKLSTRKDIAITSSFENNIEINHIDAQKGVALEKFVHLKHISLEETMAIGDNYNDISMFVKAGFSVAMENAPEAVKQQAKAMTTSNEKDGVARAILQKLKVSQ